MRPSIRVSLPSPNASHLISEHFACARTFRLRAALVAIALALGTLPSIVRAESCVDYTTFAHHLGTASAPGISRVALGGSNAFAVIWGEVAVFDITDLGLPTQLAVVPGISTARDLCVRDDFAYVAADAAGLKIVDVSNPQAPVIVGSLVMPGRAQDVNARGSLAYVACGQAGIQVVDVSSPASPAIVGAVATPGAVYQVSLTGNLVCAVDSSGVLRVADVSNPQSPVLVGSKVVGANSVSAEGSVVCVTASFDHAKVIDISNPANPIVRASIAAEGSDMAMDVTIVDGIAYIAHGNIYPAPPGGVLIADLSSPATPVILGNLGSHSMIMSVAADEGRVVSAQVYDVVSAGWLMNTYTVPTNATVSEIGSLAESMSDITVRGSTGYAIQPLPGFQPDLLLVLDVSDPESPALTDELVLPRNAITVAVNGDYAYVTTGVGSEDDALLVIDISGSPVLLGEVALPGDGQDIEIVENTAYLATKFNFGLTILDISAPANPVVLSFLPLPGSPRSVSVAGTHAYLDASSTGVSVVDVTNPAAPVVVGTVATPKRASRVDVSGSVGVVGFMPDSEGLGGIAALDVTNPAAPILGGMIESPEMVNDLEILGDNAYSIQRGIGVQVFNISNPYEPVLLGGSSAVINYAHIELGDGVAFIADDYRGLRVLPTHCPAGTGVGSPTDAHPVSALETPSPNPTSGGTTLRFALSRDTDLRIQVFDTSGRRVRSLPSGRFTAGSHALAWDGRDDSGSQVGSGMYLFELASPESRATGRVTLIR